MVIVMEGWVAFVLLFGGLFLAGSLRVVFRPVTMLATGLLALSYVGFVIYQTVWALSCWHCRSGDLPRRVYYGFSLGYDLVFLLAAIGVVWFAAGVSIAAREGIHALRRRA